MANRIGKNYYENNERRFCRKDKGNKGKHKLYIFKHSMEQHLDSLVATLCPHAGLVELLIRPLLY